MDSFGKSELGLDFIPGHRPDVLCGRVSVLQRDFMASLQQLAHAIGAESGDQLVITSGATESNNLAIVGAAKANPARRHIIISAVEHPSVMEAAESLRLGGYKVSIVPVNSYGVTAPESLLEVLSPDTLLVSVMMANNETGVVQPLQFISEVVKRNDPAILFHTDATQAAGKVPIDLSSELANIDLLSLSAHKFHGPKGVAALFVRDPGTISPILHGGGQQAGLRPGTENPAAVVGMSTALTTLIAQSARFITTRALRDNVEARILAAHPGAFALGASAQRLATTANVCIPGLDGEALVDQLASQGIAISTGSACAHGARKPSYVAVALGLTYEQARSCVRISLSVDSTEREIDTFLSGFGTALRIIRMHESPALATISS